jgi:hypothetical protein
MTDRRPDDLLEVAGGRIYRITNFKPIEVTEQLVQVILYLDPRPGDDLAVGDTGCVCLDQHLFDCWVIKTSRRSVWVNSQGPVRLVSK